MENSSLLAQTMVGFDLLLRFEIAQRLTFSNNRKLLPVGAKDEHTEGSLQG
jgi:hypothetical protein